MFLLKNNNDAWSTLRRRRTKGLLRRRRTSPTLDGGPLQLSTEDLSVNDRWPIPQMRANATSSQTRKSKRLNHHANLKSADTKSFSPEISNPHTRDTMSYASPPSPERNSVVIEYLLNSRAGGKYKKTIAATMESTPFNSAQAEIDRQDAVTLVVLWTKRSCTTDVKGGA